MTASPTGRLPTRTHRRPLASQGQHRPPTPRPRPPPRLTLEAEAHRPGSAPPWLVPLSSEGGTWRGWRPIRAARTPLTKDSARVGESSAQAPLRGEGRRQQQRRACAREGGNERVVRGAGARAARAGGKAGGAAPSRPLSEHRFGDPFPSRFPSGRKPPRFLPDPPQLLASRVVLSPPLRRPRSSRHGRVPPPGPAGR